MIAKVSEYSLDLKPIKLKVLNFFNFTLFFLRLWQLLSWCTLSRKFIHVFSIWGSKDNISYKNDLTSGKKGLIFPISVNFSLGFVFLVHKHSTRATAMYYLFRMSSQENTLRTFIFAQIIDIMLCSWSCCLQIVWVRYFKDCNEMA